MGWLEKKAVNLRYLSWNVIGVIRLKSRHDRLIGGNPYPTPILIKENNMKCLELMFATLALFSIIAAYFTVGIELATIALLLSMAIAAIYYIILRATSR